MPSIDFFSADEVRELLTFDTAIGALESALAAGLSPEDDGPRLFADAPDGEFLLMPAQSAKFSGVKALTIAPSNPDRGLEKIQGLYLLYSSDTLAPIAVMEGSCLTAIRTPSVTLTAIRHLARLAPEGARLGSDPRILLFGAGTQAIEHIRAALVDFPDATFEVVGRRPERVAAMIAELAADPATAHVRVAAATDDDAAVAAADIIILTTTATSPVFDGSLVADNAIVAATGTHGLDAREVDDTLVSRADVAVEGRGSARRENGNLATVFDEAKWESSPPANLQDLVRGNFTRTLGRPAFYTGVGMSWEDLVCASAVYTARQRP
ncbi:ornithine cyclodeaminase family protein [Leucobacter aridicollis]|uniref:ornithine cyclodeaminase family protein n=1 Tax=Leucobacter aridicollis TaxID=283878 RepID=UPI000EAEA70B|nr:ornithine cyclodeaminase family protein [Leucobacter aridicollis]